MNLARIEKLIKHIDLSSAFLLTGRFDVSYFTGIDLDGFWLLCAHDDVFYISSPLLASQLKWLDPKAKIIESSVYINSVNKIANKYAIKTLLTDLSKISVLLYKRFSPKFRVKHSGLATDLRMIKDNSEIAGIRASCRLATACAEHIIKSISPGMTETQICFKIEEYFANSQARISFVPIVASGPNSANPHHICSHRKIENNDIITIDLGCIFHGYASDLTRTIFLGKMTRLQKQVFSLVKQAKENAQRQIRENMRAKSIDAIARKIISSGGYGKYFVHSAGHGIGLEIHEPPRLSKSDKTILKSGMCITVEPGIYIPGQFGVRLEDTVVVTKNGCEVLTDPLGMNL